MNSLRQVFWVKALWLVVCAGSFYAVAAPAWQFYPGRSIPPWQRRGSPLDMTARQQKLHNLTRDQGRKPKRVPLKYSTEVSCTVLRWAPPPKPALNLTCPPSNVLAPIRLYLDMSWGSPEVVPGKVQDVVAGANVLAKMRMPAKDRTGRPVAAVELPTRHHGRGKERQEWFMFDRVTVQVVAQ